MNLFWEEAIGVFLFVLLLLAGGLIYKISGTGPQLDDVGIKHQDFLDSVRDASRKCKNAASVHSLLVDPGQQPFRYGSMGSIDKTDKTSGFKLIQNFKADYTDAEFTQYESQRTGMRVVVVDRKGPKVRQEHGTFCQLV